MFAASNAVVVAGSVTFMTSPLARTVATRTSGMAVLACSAESANSRAA
jgi:hypothetical protein